MDQMHPSQRPSLPFALESPSLNLNFSATPWLPTPSPTLRLPTPTLEALAGTDWSSFHNLSSANPVSNSGANNPNNISYLTTPTRQSSAPQGTSNAIDNSTHPSQQSLPLPYPPLPTAGFSAGLSPKFFPDMMSPGVSGGLAGTLPQQPSLRSTQSLSELFLSPEYPASTSPAPALSVAPTSNTNASIAASTSEYSHQTTQQLTQPQDRSQHLRLPDYAAPAARPSEQAHANPQMHYQPNGHASLVRQPALHPLPDEERKLDDLAESKNRKKARAAPRRVAPSANIDSVTDRETSSGKSLGRPFGNSETISGRSAVEAAASAARLKADRFAEERKQKRVADGSYGGTGSKRSRDDSSGEECNISAPLSDADAALSPSELKKKRYQRRLELNRQSAAVSRVRRREYVKELEEKLVDVEKEKFKLESQVASMGSENDRLRQVMRDLQAQLGNTNASLRSGTRAPRVPRSSVSGRRI